TATHARESLRLRQVGLYWAAQGSRQTHSRPKDRCAARASSPSQRDRDQQQSPPVAPWIRLERRTPHPSPRCHSSIANLTAEEAPMTTSEQSTNQWDAT